MEGIRLMNTTKKNLTLLLILLSAGCGDSPKTTENADTGTGPSDTSASGPTTAGPGSADGTGTADTGGTGTATGTATGETTDNPTSNGPTSATLTSSTETDGPCGGAPVFETDIVPILTASCGANDNACHSRVAYAAAVNSDCRGWLALEDVPLGSVYYAGPDEGQPTGCSDMELYMRLMQLDAWQCEQFDPRIRYVVPCKPEESYIIHKIDGGPYCSLGQNMPSQPMPLGMPLPQAELDTIKAWIAAGAPRLGDACPIDCDGPDPGTTGDTTSSTTSETTNGGEQDPIAQINHPGDGENRPVNVDIPFVGLGTDPQDGMIPGNMLVWTSDLEGQIGVGGNFNAPLTMVGMHTITLTATDSDNNVGIDSLMLNIQ
jgi:hypothetical protein